MHIILLDTDRLIKNGSHSQTVCTHTIHLSALCIIQKVSL